MKILQENRPLRLQYGLQKNKQTNIERIWWQLLLLFININIDL